MIQMNDLFYRYLKVLGMCILLLKNSAFSQINSEFDSIDISVENFMSKKNVPGFIACIVKDSSIMWSKTYGNADIQNNVSMSMDAIMNIGSISKTFTATAALQLWEKGLIKLDSDINEYLDFKVCNPKYPDTPITVFQLLTHTSSIGGGKAYFYSYSCGDPSISLKEWIYNYFTPGGKFYNLEENFEDWSPGSNFRYSNVAYGLLGLVVEEVARQPFNKYCKEFIFEPLGMVNTGWYLNEINIDSHIKPYVFVTEEEVNYLKKRDYLLPNTGDISVGEMLEFCLYSFPNYPDGLVRTNVRELSYFLSAIMNGGRLNENKILNKETVDMMLSPQLPELSLQQKENHLQGLCWRTSKINSTWGHDGSDPGIATIMIFNPNKKIGVITFQNTESDGAFKIVKELFLTIESK